MARPGELLTVALLALVLQSEAQPKMPSASLSKTKQSLKEPVQYNQMEWAQILVKLQPQIDGVAPKNATMKQPEEAGRVNMVSSQIIGGHLSSRGQFPWQAGIAVDVQFFCGGSIITPHHVLTAGHCTKGFSTFAVMLGAQDKTAFESGRVTLETTKVVYHERYNDDTLVNDIALLFLPVAVPFTTNLIKPIRLPSRSQATSVTYVGMNVTASGWGRTSDDNPGVSDVMYNVVLTVISLAECVKEYGTTYVNKNNVCVSGKDLKATCNGDSGGPLVTKEADGIWTQIGLVSFGAAEGCAKLKPSVFTRVSSHLNWISAKTRYSFRDRD